MTRATFLLLVCSAVSVLCLLGGIISYATTTFDACTSTCGPLPDDCNVGVLLSVPPWSPAPPHMRWGPYAEIGVYISTPPVWFDAVGAGEHIGDAIGNWNTSTTSISLHLGGTGYQIDWVTDKGVWSSYGQTDSVLAATWPADYDPQGFVTSMLTYVNAAHFEDDDWGDEPGCPGPGEVSFKGVMNHELGHVLGFAFDGHPVPICAGCTVMILGPARGDCTSHETLGALDFEAMQCLYKAAGEQATWDDSWMVRRNAEEPSPVDSFLRRKLVALEEQRERRSTPGAVRAQRQGESYVIFTPSTFVGDVQSFVAGYWQAQGYNPTIVNVSTFPTDQDQFRVTLKAAIANYASTGTKYFHLIGDSNDWREFDNEEDLWPTLWIGSDWAAKYNGYVSLDNYPARGQRSRDLIPTYSVADVLPRGENMAWYTPYWHSDQDYADVDDDGVPDVVLTRWPVASNSDLLSIAYKMQMYNDFEGTSEAYNVAFYVGNKDYHAGPCDPHPCYDGRLAMDHADSVETRLQQIAPAQDIAHLYALDYVDPSERNNHAVQLWNTFQPEVAIILSSWSDRYYPGDFFDETCSNPFDMGLISSPNSALVIAATCGTADWAWTEDPDFERPVCEDFLTAWDAGAVAWIGPTKAAYGRASFRATLYTVEELFQHDRRPMAESWLIAMQRLYADFSNQLRYCNAFNEYVFLGDPLSPLRHRSDIPTSVGETSIRGDPKIVRCTPNPFNACTQIGFSIASRGLVNLQIYDVEGGRVRALVDKIMPPGEYSVEWGGENDYGESMASGVYFCRLTTANSSVTRKLVLLK